MSLKINSSALSSTTRYLEDTAADHLAVSREKMISLLVEARLLQTAQGRSQLLPPLKKSGTSQITLAITLLSEVFGHAAVLSKDQRHLVASYFTDEEMGQLSLFVNMPRFINLSDFNTFKQYAGKEFENRQIDLFQGAMIAQQIYESAKRSISQTQYGQAFCMNPEILAYAMQLADKEIVLEIAGATGENGAILAFSGAEKVYVNDICQEEMEAFEKTKANLPNYVREKLESIRGDCFDLLDLKPGLMGRVGLILSRNLIHFLNDEKQEKFFALLKNLLRPGGRAVFSVNSIYQHSLQKKLFKKHPNTTSFSSVFGTINDYAYGTKPIGIFFNELLPCSSTQVSTDFVAHYIYRREEGSPWKPNSEEFNKLDKELHPKIQNALSPLKKTMKTIQSGSVRVVENKLRLYNIKTLPRLFQRNGFQVEYTFVTASNGHLVHKRNPFGVGYLMGVIVRYHGDN